MVNLLRGIMTVLILQNFLTAVLIWLAAKNQKRGESGDVEV